jgi:hypothetical protein
MPNSDSKGGRSKLASSDSRVPWENDHYKLQRCVGKWENDNKRLQLGVVMRRKCSFALSGGEASDVASTDASWSR